MLRAADSLAPVNSMYINNNLMLSYLFKRIRASSPRLLQLLNQALAI